MGGSELKKGDQFGHASPSPIFSECPTRAMISTKYVRIVGFYNQHIKVIPLDKSDCIQICTDQYMMILPASASLYKRIIEKSKLAVSAPHILRITTFLS